MTFIFRHAGWNHNKLQTNTTLETILKPDLCFLLLIRWIKHNKHAVPFKLSLIVCLKLSFRCNKYKYWCYVASGKSSLDQLVHHILSRASGMSKPAMLIPPDRQMKSVITQTQMLLQGYKVTHTCTKMTPQTHTSWNILNMHVYPHMLCNHTTNHSLILNTCGHWYIRAIICTHTAHAHVFRTIYHEDLGLHAHVHTFIHTFRAPVSWWGHTIPSLSKAPVCPPWQ